ncbi:MAG: acetyl-CoA acetyltransferase [SAR324 cluster bacterium]|nr:acetyl-CoA acetyltransferase [SAR324 cluster bacterium]
MTASITGWAHTRFGRLEDEDSESLIVRVVREAIADAGLEAKDIDAIYLGTFNAGMSPQEFPGALALQADDALRFKPVTRVENACATGSAAIYQGLHAIKSGSAHNVLCVGVEKMTACDTATVGKSLVRASYVAEEASEGMTFPGIFGKIAQGYFERYGDQSDALAAIAAKNHKNGSVNPLAHFQKDLGYDFCRNESEKNPYVARPLKRTDCSMISDGAAALVLSSADVAQGAKKAVAFRTATQVNDFLPMSRRDIVSFEGPKVAWARALEDAKLSLDDLSFVETHDCFTIAELIEYEAMGLTEAGDGARAVQEGWTQKDGKLPVNPSGGLKAKGHPVGATGVSMHVMAAMQLTGTAGGCQVNGAKLGSVFNMGGAAVANYVSVLESVR